ncbi:C40 family peptidase [Brevundimonas naejangsanensis]|uniref:C40 family peptidase n=1 Tax=Brevundimonas naejangsanensis TaxID=588932 RepID=UPI0034D5BE50
MSEALALIPPGALLSRPDLAELSLEGLVRASTYRATIAHRLGMVCADILTQPYDRAEVVDQLVFGEIFDVLDSRDGFVWGRARRDGVVGWVRQTGLKPPTETITHRIRTASAPVHAEAEGGAAIMTLPMNALVRVVEQREGRVRLDQAGWASADDLAALDQFEVNPADAAEQFIGAPHRLGGRTFEGIDCVGLAQQALYACGLAGPRYAPGLAEIGQAVVLDKARRGDLIVWRSDDAGVWGGHAGVMADNGRLIHASGEAGRVLVEPLAEVAARYATRGFSVPALQRPGF